MKPLRSAFGEGDYKFVLIERSGGWAIYSQSFKGKLIAYEVFKVRVEGSRDWSDGRVTVEHERYAKPSEWGKTAWTCLTLERARQRMAEGLAKDARNAKEGG